MRMAAEKEQLFGKIFWAKNEISGSCGKKCR